MKSIILFIFSFLIGTGVIIAYTNKSQKPKQAKVILKPASSSTFSIVSPPSESLKGIIASKSGTLLWESRIATEPGKLNDNVPIQQGEPLVTEAESQVTVNFTEVGSIDLSENADLSFIQTLPVDFVVEQKKGKIGYKVTGKTPLSIRIRNTVITKTSGIIQIAVADEDPIILISTMQGTAQIAFNDLDYVSQVFTLHEGQIYEYNSDERTAINVKNK